jgi:putative inorganic carbon (HCO3(-)) transporter
MGKRSREKRERREKRESGEIVSEKEKLEIRPVAICKGIILFGTGLSLFAPLFVSGQFFFPFVGPKSLYFMGLVELIFAAWLILIILAPQYRPKLNILLIAIILFVAVLILSTLFGADISRSFWSKYERMTGLLMWFHLLAFFLVISSTFKKESDWFKIFGVSIFAAILVSLISLIVKANPSAAGMLAASRGGATIGNSSFMGTYLLFNLFLALYLILKTTGGLRIYSGISLVIISLALFLSDARAAILSVLGGLVLLFLLWLIFYQKGSLKFAGISLLLIFAIGVLGLMYFSSQPGSFVYQKFVQMASKSRLVVWEIAWKGFLEKPWLGWGPENFELAFTKYFDPRLGLPEYGGEVWFDKAHNIVMDTLVATGIIGFLTYLGIFLASFYILWKKFFQKRFNFCLTSIFSVTLISYSVQNLTVFDMVNSYLIFFLVLGFIGSIRSTREETIPSKKVSSLKTLMIGIILILFAFSFFEFVLQPLKTDAYVIQAIRSPDSAQRLILYKKTLETSPVGKYQIREFFADSVINFFFNKTAQRTARENIIGEFDFVSKELEKSIKESPLDYRAYLKLGQVYNAWSNFDPTKVSQVEEVLNQARELSPRNQQTYWALAQTKIQQGDIKEALSLAEKAVELEPNLERSHIIVIRIAQWLGDSELAERKIKEALSINPAWEKDLNEILNKSQ